jgi:hypothetical protein
MGNYLKIILGTLLLANMAQAYSPSYDPEYNCKMGDGDEVFIEVYLDNALVSLNNNEEVYLLSSYGLSSVLSVQDRKFKTKEGGKSVSLQFKGKKKPRAHLLIEEDEQTILDITIECRQLLLPE